MYFQCVDWVVERVIPQINVVVWKLEEQKLQFAAAMERYAIIGY